MRGCSVTKHLEIVRGKLDDYKALCCYHYRDSKLGPFAAIFSLMADGYLSRRSGTKVVGVIVYTMPSAGLELRNIATDNFFAGLGRGTVLSLINKNIRCISRVIIEPRFRGLGLASRLVRETMPKMDVPIIEAMAVMGAVNPFFEKAGMKAYTAKIPVRCVQMVEAFSLVGIEKEELIDAEVVQERLGRLKVHFAEFIEVQIKNFLSSYGRRRDMGGGMERTRYVLSKLTARPVYYIWFDPKIAFSV